MYSQVSHESGLPKWLIILLATSIGVIAANLYYAQPLVALISRSLGIPAEAAGLVVTLTQLGYGIGVLGLVPLGDMIETRSLVVTMIAFAICGLLGLAFATHPTPYFIAAFATGLGSAGVQVIVPYAAHFASDAKRGQVIGMMTSGLMLGIMLSRPIASLVSDLLSWHAVFVLSASLMLVIAVALFYLMPPKNVVRDDLRYFSLLGSMLSLYVTKPLLRRRAIYQAFIFGSFCYFWTAAPLLLGGPAFGFSQTKIAIFALVGITGAVSAPFAGRAADRGWVAPATLFALLISMAAFLITVIFTMGSVASLATLVVGAILLDAGVTANLVLGQRVIFELGASFRSRLNALYIATIFIGGATGSTLGSWAFAKGGWELTAWVGTAMPLAAPLFFSTEFIGQTKEKSR
jgi:predicted MFS family arabinose efflux permease